MSIHTGYPGVRFVWVVLTPTAKFYIAALLVAAAYTTYSCIHTVFHLRHVLRHSTSSDTEYLKAHLIEMTRRIESLRQLQLLMLLLFGTVFAHEMFALIRAVENSSMSLSGARIDILEPVAAFAFFVFVVLLLLHVFQWTVAARLRLFCRN
jgi:hypothetical protein